MVLPHIVTVEHGKSETVKSVGDGKSMNLLGKTINASKNSIITIGEVKACNEIN